MIELTWNERPKTEKYKQKREKYAMFLFLFTLKKKTYLITTRRILDTVKWNCKQLSKKLSNKKETNFESDKAVSIIFRERTT